MVLDSEQARRFCRLYGALLAYANQRLGVIRRDDSAHDQALLSEPEQLQVAHALWQAPSMQSLVEDFVLENPAGLSRRDLKEALSWRAALWGPSVVVCDGADTLFLHDEYAFAVCGLSIEISQLLRNVPTFVNAVLLPFDGLITYGVSLEEYLLDMTDDMAATAIRDVATMRARGNVVSTAAAFGDVAPRVGKRRLELEAQRFALQMELDMNADELGPGQHRGALAGLQWDKRESAVAAHVHPDDSAQQGERVVSAEKASESRQLMLDVAADLCVPGDPAERLVDVLAHFDRRRLTKVAWMLGVRPSTLITDDATTQPVVPAQTKTCAATPSTDGLAQAAPVHNTTFQLAAAMAQRIPLDTDSLLRPARESGVSSLLDLHRLIDAGGRIEVADSELSSLADLVKPIFPLTFLFHANNVFTCVMPREVRRSLADVDWDAELDHALAIEEAVHFVDLLVDLCGVVSIEEAVAAYEAYFEDHAETAAVVAAVLHTADAETACFELIELDDEPYLVDYEAVRPPSHTSDDSVLARFLRERPAERGYAGKHRVPATSSDSVPHEVDIATDSAAAHDQYRERVARKLLAAHGSRAPRPLTDELLACDDVVTWVLRQSPAQTLTAYLDAHVPNGADDYRFADRVVERIVAASRDTVSPTDIINYLRTEGFVPTDAQLFRLFDLVMELTNAVPKWANNGWPPLDVVALS